MKKNDTTIFCIIFLFCLAMVPAIYNFVDTSGDYEVSPLFWPLTAAYLGIFFSAVAFVMALRRGESFAPWEMFSGIAANRTQILFLILAAAYLYSMNYVGFFAASLVMLPVMMLFFGYRRYVAGLVISTTFVVAVYLLFNKVFKIYFPEWMLGGF